MSDNTTNSISESRAAKSRGLYILTVGIGTDGSMRAEHRAVARNATEADLLNIVRASQSRVLVDTLLGFICPHSNIDGKLGCLIGHFAL